MWKKFRMFPVLRVVREVYLRKVYDLKKICRLSYVAFKISWIFFISDEKNLYCKIKMLLLWGLKSRKKSIIKFYFFWYFIDMNKWTENMCMINTYLFNKQSIYHSFKFIPHTICSWSTLKIVHICSMSKEATSVSLIFHIKF